MTLLRVCPTCYQSYQDISQNFCMNDGFRLSEPFPIPLPESAPEIQTVIRASTSVRENSIVNGAGESSRRTPARPRTNAKGFLSQHFPELLRHKRRSSRSWESSENPAYHNIWWFNFSETDLDESEYIVFAGALDKINVNFRVLKIPTSYIRENISKLDRTSDGWINVYIHMYDLSDTRNKAHLSFEEFAVN